MLHVQEMKSFIIWCMWLSQIVMENLCLQDIVKNLCLQGVVEPVCTGSHDIITFLLNCYNLSQSYTL